MTTLVSEFWRATTPAQEKREDGYRLIAHLYDDEKLSYDQIKECVGCGYSTIMRALKANGVTPRPAHGPKGPRSKVVHRPRWARVVKRKSRVTCGRCGLLLKEFPGRAEGLCCLCCEDMARGIVYGGESVDDFVRWGEAMMREVEG